MLPPDAYELIGRAVAKHLELIDAKCDAMFARSELRLSGICTQASEKLATIKDGETGAKGDTGESGARGDKGDIGEKGETGPEGQKGDKGDTGNQGLQGDPGIISAEAIADAYQGIWSEGEYQRGQIVTFGGSWWLSLDKNADKPGDGNDNWKLIVKRGRDGKDGKDGKDGVKGEKGDTGYYRGIKE